MKIGRGDVITYISMDFTILFSCRSPLFTVYLTQEFGCEKGKMYKLP